MQQLLFKNHINIIYFQNFTYVYLNMVDVEDTDKEIEDTDKEIEDIDKEIEAIHQILSKSIDQHYGIVNDGKKLSTDEHFIFWDRMWNLVLQKRKMLNDV